MIEASKPREVLEVSELKQFLKLLISWHSKKVAELEHMLEIPEGTEVEFSGVGTFLLTGEARNGFQAGLSLALIELGRLPFYVRPDPQPTTSDVAETYPS